MSQTMGNKQNHRNPSKNSGLRCRAFAAWTREVHQAPQSLANAQVQLEIRRSSSARLANRKLYMVHRMDTWHGTTNLKHERRGNGAESKKDSWPANQTPISRLIKFDAASPHNWLEREIRLLQEPFNQATKIFWSLSAVSMADHETRKPSEHLIDIFVRVPWPQRGEGALTKDAWQRVSELAKGSLRWF